MRSRMNFSERTAKSGGSVDTNYCGHLSLRYISSHVGCIGKQTSLRHSYNWPETSTLHFVKS